MLRTGRDFEANFKLLERPQELQNFTGIIDWIVLPVRHNPTAIAPFQDNFVVCVLNPDFRNSAFSEGLHEIFAYLLIVRAESLRSIEKDTRGYDCADGGSSDQK